MSPFRSFSLLAVAFCVGCTAQTATTQSSNLPQKPATASTSVEVASSKPVTPITPAPSSSSPIEPVSNDGWSAPVDGIRGRLIATKTTDAKGRLEARLEVELENVSASKKPIDIWWGDFNEMLRFSLDDEAGKDLPSEAPGGNYLSGPPHWQTVVSGKPVRLTISETAYEYVPTGLVLFRPLTFQAWDVPSAKGKIFARAALTPSTVPIPVADAAGHHGWKGTLDLPRVEVH